MEKNDFSSTTNGKDISKNYQNNENFYIHQSDEKFEPKYGYDEKNHYSNISRNYNNVYIEFWIFVK